MNNRAEGKPRFGMEFPEGGNVNRNIYAAPGSTEVLGAQLKCTHYEEKAGQTLSVAPFPEL